MVHHLSIIHLIAVLFDENSEFHGIPIFQCQFFSFEQCKNIVQKISIAVAILILWLHCAHYKQGKQVHGNILQKKFVWNISQWKCTVLNTLIYLDMKSKDTGVLTNVFHELALISEDTLIEFS